MKQKFLNLIGICCIVLSVCFINDVRANEQPNKPSSSGSNIISGSDSSNENISNVDCETGGCPIFPLQGIRITVVDNRGNRIKNTISVDYMNADANTSDILNRKYPYVYINSDNTVKYKKEVVDIWRSSRTNSYDTLNWKKINAKQYKPHKLSFKKIMFQDNIEREYFQNYFKKMSDSELTAIFNATMQKSYSSYKEALSKISSDVCNEIYGGYFMFEPILALYFPGKGVYIGTYTELMTLPKLDTSSGLSTFRYRIALYDLPFSITLDYSSTNQVERLNLIRQLGFIPIEYSLQEWKKNTQYGDEGKFWPESGKDYRGKRFLKHYTNAFYKETEGGKYLGVGIGAFAITDIIDNPCSSCYEASHSCTKTACEKTNDNNERTCITDITSVTCSEDIDEETVHESGEKTIELIDGVCSLYCKESSTVSYPGNVSPAIELGTNLEWPTKGESSMYPLTTTSKLSCKIEMNDNSTVTQECINKAVRKDYSYKIGNTNALLEYEVPTKEVDPDKKSSSHLITLKQKCNSSIDVNGTSVTIENNCSYTLPTDKNIAIDKNTSEFINAASTAITNYIIMQNGGVLPIEGYNWYDRNIISKVLFEDTYDLKISNLPLGYDGKYTNLLDDKFDATDDYVCKYSITTAITNTPCVCPPGTINSGYDLTSKLEEKSMTCAEAIEMYCNNTELKVCPDDSDTPGTRYEDTDEYKNCIENNNELYCMNLVCYKSSPDVCPKDSLMPGYKYQEDNSYKACMAGGGTKTECMKLICNPECGTNCEYTCPEKTDYQGKDITTCVYKERGAGKTLVDALNSCYDSECYIGLGNKKIIYRTISLENPFPSIDADKSTSQDGLSALNYSSLDTSKKTFNQTVKGRYPGTNWNGVQLVYNKILNNRGYAGSKIYNEAEPLYVIELDSKSIKAIRDYNKDQNKTDDGYADFTLECTDGAYCRSTFLRDSTITGISGNNILTGGTCQNVSNKSEFISCYKTATSD